MITLRVGNTHLYAGADGVLKAGSAADLDARTPLDCTVEFSDGGMALAGLVRIDGDIWRLSVGRHVTARGTTIEEKVWRIDIEPAEKAEWRFRVGKQEPALRPSR